MTKQVLQQALEALERIVSEAKSPTQRINMIGAYMQAEAAIEALRSALAQQPELSTASKSEQLLASHDHALRAEFQRMKAALAQQGETVAWLITHGEDCFATNETAYAMSFDESERQALGFITAPAAQLIEKLKGGE